MALEQFKTQVLLLHSEQDTLDALSAGFRVNDKYAVHFATSGSEALSTLGETPIHVIVSAQDLPGMSGLEALREAKKRSPDTIGILLAGSDRDDGLEALVGDKEVFQIVRGAITPDALLNVIDTATKRVRLLAISESANDTAADVDEAAPVDSGEHIVMETAENGSTIISDGTGRMPALRPEKIQPSPTASGREVDVLVLSKDEEFLNTIRDSSRGMHNVHHAVTAAQAQEIVRNYKVGVLVTDAAIAGSKVQVLTQALRRDVPRLVAVVAGRRDDGELLMDLINQGQVYRFLLKPVSPGRARLAIEASVKHHLDGAESAFKGQGRKAAPTPAAKPAAADAPDTADTGTAAQVDSGRSPQQPADSGDDTDSGRITPVIDTLPADETVATADLESPPPGDDSLGDEASSKRPIVIAAAAAVVLAIAGIGFFAGGSPDAEPPQAAASDEAPADSAPQRTPAVTESDVPAQQAVPPAADPAYVALLDDARFARDAGRIVAPAGNNSVEFYVAARDAAPDNELVAEELGALVEQVLAMAESALLENRATDARTALQMVALADADNPRLTFLNAQLAQLQLRVTLDDARAAIRDARFEDAAGLIEQARTYAGANAADIDGLAAELAAAQSAQEVGDVLALASARMTEDRLTAPSNDNARYYFSLALRNDPGNAAAEQGLIVIASKLVLRARNAIDTGSLENAAALLDEARALDADSGELQAAASALDTARAAQADAERQAELVRLEAEQRAEAERLAEVRRANANSATLTNNPADAPPDGAASASFAPAAAATSLGGRSAAQGKPGSAVPPASDDGTLDGAAGEGATLDAAVDPELVAISDLVRVNYVAPEYPRSAQRRNITGWVDVSFTVTPRGTVADIDVLESTPGSVFDDAATDAVGEWRFEPVVEDGRAVPRRVAVRMAFSLE